MQKKTLVLVTDSSKEESKAIVKQLLQSVEVYACSAIDQRVDWRDGFKQIDEALCFVRALAMSKDLGP